MGQYTLVGNSKERYLELVNTPEANVPTTNGNRGKSLPEINGGAEGIRTIDPLLAKRIVWYLKAHSHIQISSLCTRSCSWVYKRNLKKYLKNLGPSTTSVGAFLVEEDTMQIKELKAKTKESDNKTPTPPNEPVALSRWVQVTHNDPKSPKKQPDDPALAPTSMKKPIPSNVIGTDKPERKKPIRPILPVPEFPATLESPGGYQRVR